MYRYLILFLLSFLVGRANAQLIHGNDLIWTRYMVQTTGTSNNFLIAELDNRVQSKAGIGKRNQSIFHLHQHYKLTPSIDIALGTSYSNVAKYNPLEKESDNISEVRLFEEVNTKHLDKEQSAIQSRIRIEQRYFPTQKIEGTDVPLPIQSRLRYQIQYTHKLGKHAILKASNEIMFHAGGWVDHLRMDQNRVYLAARNQFTPSLAFEAGYLWIINQGVAVISPMRETDILRFTLHHSLAMKEK